MIPIISLPVSSYIGSKTSACSSNLKGVIKDIFVDWLVEQEFHTVLCGEIRLSNTNKDDFNFIGIGEKQYYIIDSKGNIYNRFFDDDEIRVIIVRQEEDCFTVEDIQPFGSFVGKAYSNNPIYHVVSNKGTVLFLNCYGYEDFNGNNIAIYDKPHDRYFDFLENDDWDYYVDKLNIVYSRNLLQQEKYACIVVEALMDIMSFQWFKQRSISYPILNKSGEIEYYWYLKIGKVNVVRDEKGQFYLSCKETLHIFDSLGNICVWKHDVTACSVIIFNRNQMIHINSISGKSTIVNENIKSPCWLHTSRKNIGRYFSIFYDVSDNIYVLDKQGTIIYTTNYKEDLHHKYGFSGDFLYFIERWNVNLKSVYGDDLGGYTNYQIPPNRYRNKIKEGFFNDDFFIIKHNLGDIERYGLAEKKYLKKILPLVFDAIDVVYYKNPLYDSKEKNNFWYNPKIMFFITLKDLGGSTMEGVFIQNDNILMPLKAYRKLYPLTYTITYYHSYERRIPSGHPSLISCMSETVSTGSEEKIYCSGWIYSEDLAGNITLSYEDNHYQINGLKKIVHSRFCYFLLIITTDKGIGVLGPLGWLIKPTYTKIECYDCYSNGKPEEIERINESKFFVCDGEIIRIDFSKYDRNKTIENISVEVIFTPGNRYRYCGIEHINCYDYVAYEDLEETNAHPYKERAYYAHDGYRLSKDSEVRFPSVVDNDF